MGLDMYLQGRTWPKSEDTDDDYDRYEKLGYWRKHPNLHGYIVQTFADGVDECQLIELTKLDLLAIIEAVQTDALPLTKGFFFGVSDGPDDQDTTAQITKAIEWLDAAPGRRVTYEASW